MITNVRKKLVSLDDLSETAATLKSQGKVLVLCYGDFELLHPGHIRHLETARRHGDLLAVVLTKDQHVGKGPGHPFFNERLRAESLGALELVDYVAVSPIPSAAEVIRKVRPGVYAKGGEKDSPHDYTSKGIAERQAMKEVGGQLVITDVASFSSSRLLNDHFPVFSEETASFLRQFRERYEVWDIVGRLENLSGLKVLVIGDTIIDEYHFCKAVGKASKSANIAAKFLYSESYAGGALAVANQVASFVSEVCLVTCLGASDSQEELVRAHLKPNIHSRFFYRTHAPTIVKRRFIDPFMINKMFEVCFADDTDLPPRLQADVVDYLVRALSEYDVVIAADFGHGFISGDIVPALCEHARYLALNAQANSLNFGFNIATKYPRADYVCIDEQEARLAAHRKYGPLDEIVDMLVGRMCCSMLSVTLGGRGSLVYTTGQKPINVPSFSTDVVDTVGAGDAYLSLTSLCAAASQPGDLLGLVGNAVGALAVRIVGNKDSVESERLFSFISSLLQ